MHSPLTCLLVEDSPEWNRALTSAIRPFIRVDQVTSLAGALLHLAEQDSGYDLVILDRNLPDGDALELVPIIQSDFPKTKICLLTSQGSESDQVDGLRQGADLYLSKPLTVQCVREHVKALLRRGRRTVDNSWHWQDVSLDATSRTLCLQEVEIQLTRQEARCIQVFFGSHEGKASRDDLSEVLFPQQGDPSPGAIHITIQRLRKKVQQLGLTIRSQYGAGYQLIKVTT